MARSSGSSSSGCTCPPAWRKPGPDAVDRQGHAPECALEIARVEAEGLAVHTRGAGEIPVHGKE